MRLPLALATLCLLCVTAGCSFEAGYGGAYGVAGEYPDTYYAPAPVYAAPVYPYPYGYYGPVYDRDHYFDRYHHWDRHGYHYDWH